MRTRLLILATVAGLMFPMTAGAATATRSSSARPVEQQRAPGAVEVRYRNDGGTTTRQVSHPGLAGLPARPSVAQLRAALTEQAMMAAEEEASAAPAFSEVHVSGAPDLDGDGRKDLVAVEMDGEQVTYRGIRGLTGAKAWAHTDAGQYGYTVPARVGVDGGRGLLALSISFEGGEDPENPNFTSSTVVTALAADGTPLWSHTYEGSGTSTPTGFVYEGLAYVAGIGRMNDSAANELLVAVLDGADTAVGSSAHAQVLVLDGTDGSTAAATEVVASQGWIGAGLLPDLDGDGLEDFGTVASQTGDRNAVTTHRGTDGSMIWQTMTAGGIAFGLDGAGDTDGDGVSDVLLLGFDLETFTGTAAVLAGADGSMRWDTKGDFATAVRDVTGDGMADVITQSVHDEFDSPEAGREDQFGARYVMRSGADGSVVWRRTYGVQFGDQGGMGMVGLYGPVGDVDGDRRVDLGHEASTMSFDGTRDDNSGVVRSRDGRRTLRRGIGTPLLARVDARGDDFALTAEIDSLLRVRVRDGRTGKRVWQRMLPGVSDGGYVTVSAADVVGNRRAELLVVVPRRSGPMIYVLRSGRGKTLWRG